VSGLRLGSTVLPIGGVTHVMGVVNLSPESKNRFTVAETPEAALEMARRYRDEGATIIDLGAQSSHYENPTIAAEEETARLLPALDLLVEDGFLVSVDTWKVQVAAAAVRAGAVMVNDTGGLQDPAMRRVVAETGAAAVVMYVEGSNPHDVGEILIAEDKAERTASWLRDRLAVLASEGISETVVDPGIAINYRGDYDAYTRMQLRVIEELDLFRPLGRPVLVPIPRKREDHRVAAYLALAIDHGADLVRAHDVAWACDLVRLLGRAPG
jgi:dihydropteroate synthase